MRVLVVGGAGAIGRRLLPELVRRGHAVVATSRDSRRDETIRELGAKPLALDALDPAAVATAVAEVGPDVVVCQVTGLAGDFSRIGELVATNAQVRKEATLNALAAAEQRGVRRFVAQGVAFAYGPGAGPASEEEPLGDDETARAAAETDRAVLDSPLEGVVARYGLLYGPGTWHARDGAVVAALKAGDLPAAGGEQSLVHVDDAATATALLCERGEPGAYNIVDDEPVARAEWLRELAAAVGAPEPAGGQAGPGTRGASNAKLRALGWKPVYPDWREGLRLGL